MTSHRFGFLVAAAVVAVTVVGYAWSEKTSSESRFTSKVSGQCPMSAGTDAGSCPYLREKAGATLRAEHGVGAGAPGWRKMRARERETERQRVRTAGGPGESTLNAREAR